MSEHTTHIPQVRRLQRSRSDRMIAGVSGGLARYFEIHPAVFRVGFVVLTLLGGAALLIYAAAALVGGLLSYSACGPSRALSTTPGPRCGPTATYGGCS